MSEPTTATILFADGNAFVERESDGSLTCGTFRGGFLEIARMPAPKIQAAAFALLSERACGGSPPDGGPGQG